MDDRSRTLPAHDYRREARRLRARHGTDSTRLYGALRDLAREHNESHPMHAPRMRLVQDAEADTLAAGPEIEKQFITESRAMMTDGLLRQSQRDQLLKRANAFGLHRFRANLLLAIAVHELAGSNTGPTPVHVRRLLPGRPAPLGLESESIPRDRRLRTLGLIDLLMAASFAAALLLGDGVWPPRSMWDYAALATGALVFLVCPLLWLFIRFSEH